MISLFTTKELQHLRPQVFRFDHSSGPRRAISCRSRSSEVKVYSCKRKMLLKCSIRLSVRHLQFFSKSY